MERKTPLSVPAYRVEGVLGLIARVETPRFVSPVFTAVHVSPLSVERKTPISVPAYRVEGVLGLIARVETPRFVSPVFTAVHVSPLSVERKMPLLLVLAYRMVGVTGLMTREVKTFRETPFTSLSVRPVFTAVQWLPLSVERKTPP